MTHDPAFLATAFLPAARQFVMTTKLHPILVNFTAALVPVSFASDLAARLFHSESLRGTGWWTLLMAMVITPFTAIAGWLFWMKDDNGVRAMEIHRWLGSSLAVVLIGVFLWRWRFHRRNTAPSALYFLVAVLVVAALVVQGTLGGNQTFSM